MKNTQKILIAVLALVLIAVTALIIFVKTNKTDENNINNNPTDIVSMKTILYLQTRRIIRTTTTSLILNPITLRLQMLMVTKHRQQEIIPQRNQHKLQQRTMIYLLLNLCNRR